MRGRDEQNSVEEQRKSHGLERGKEVSWFSGAVELNYCYSYLLKIVLWP